MKKLIGIVLLYLPLCLTAQSTENNKGVNFEKNLSWQQLKAKAQAENKYIFLDVFATWCGPCKLMDKNVYTNDTVGTFLNDKFISGKVQMDTSSNDDEQVKKWYADAKQIGKEYRMEGYPTFLFFSPQGKLAFKVLGYQPPADFIKIAKQALNPQNLLYYTQLEEYNQGKKNYENLDDLSLFTINTVGNKQLGQQMAKDYVAHTDFNKLLNRQNIMLVKYQARNNKLADSLAKIYKADSLDNLSEKEICTKRNFLFFMPFIYLINHQDNTFKVCYNHPKMVDSIMGKGWAKQIVEYTIGKDEIREKLIKDKKPVFKAHDWNGIEKTIKSNYPLADARHILLVQKLAYYKNTDINWKEWSATKDQEINLYPPHSLNDFQLQINMPVWDAFLNCSDKEVLNKLLSWINYAISANSKVKYAAWLDTKANLLYKLGRLKEALSIEKEAATLESNAYDKQDINDNLKKMINGTPTWNSK